MTEQLTLNTVVHAAFRRTIARFEGALSTFPARSQARADQLTRAWDFFEEELHHHHHGYEEEYFWRLSAPRPPSPGPALPTPRWSHSARYFSTTWLTRNATWSRSRRPTRTRLR